MCNPDLDPCSGDNPMQRCTLDGVCDKHRLPPTPPTLQARAAAMMADTVRATVDVGHVRVEACRRGADLRIQVNGREMAPGDFRNLVQGCNRLLKFLEDE
jgi:hypothetical protein